VLRIDNFEMDMIPEGQMVLIVNSDQPGVIGTVGTSFGDASVNIADMVISREKNADGTATAFMVLKIDSVPPEALINRLRARPNIVRVKSVTLPPRNV
jgi:D-3-phosphoglycerate dehydrogenase